MWTGFSASAASCKFMLATTLVFPAVTPGAIDYARKCRREGRRVVGAASVPADTAGYDHWGNLPGVNEDDFSAAFIDLVEQQGISHLFVPVPSAWFFLERFIREKNLPLILINESPFTVQACHYAELLQTADRLQPFERVLAQGASRLGREAIAAILRQARLIHGESNEDKLTAMMGIFASAPKGDVVEIGTLMGRTAAVLRLLAETYEIGPVLTVDPWAGEQAVQKDSPVYIQDMAFAWPKNSLPDGFRINMLGMGSRNFAHLRLPSAKAFPLYASGQHLCDADFSGFTPCGRIAVMHIDGNHDYAFVKEDIDLWGTRLAPGAWVIFDDYVWMHGDGPQRAGNDFLKRKSRDMELAFCCGKALYCKLSG
jgi:hypothetical protein